jgi:hypothetical protein
MYVPQILLFVAVFTCLDHIYVGCYATADVSVLASSTLTSMRSILACRNFCVKGTGGPNYFYFGYSMVGTTTRQCNCLRPEPFFVASSKTIYSSSNCSVNMCPDDNNLCGSTTRMSVYRIAGGVFCFCLPWSNLQ